MRNFKKISKHLLIANLDTYIYFKIVHKVSIPVHALYETLGTYRTSEEIMPLNLSEKRPQSSAEREKFVKQVSENIDESGLEFVNGISVFLIR